MKQGQRRLLRSVQRAALGVLALAVSFGLLLPLAQIPLAAVRTLCRTCASTTSDTNTPLSSCGRTLYEVQQILGHSDPSVTQRYAHLSTRSLQEAANTAVLAIKGTVPAALPETTKQENSNAV